MMVFVMLSLIFIEEMISSRLKADKNPDDENAVAMDSALLESEANIFQRIHYFENLLAEDVLKYNESKKRPSCMRWSF